MNFCDCIKSPFPSTSKKFEQVNSAKTHLPFDGSNGEQKKERNLSSEHTSSDIITKPRHTVTLPITNEDATDGRAHATTLTREEPLRDSEPLTPRRNPKMRLLTSTSTLSDFAESSCTERSSDDSDCEWTTSGFPCDPPQISDVGLMITFQDGQCQFDLVPDSNYPEIHPNVYAPTELSDMRVLYGGGSGVAVFGGHHPRLGDLVMKHGGYKDSQELFALATITMELKRRGSLLDQYRCARNMQDRLPCFRMIYVSPNHIMSRGKKLMGVLKNFVRSWSLTSVPSNNTLINRSPRMRRAAMVIQQKQPQLEVGMKIRIFEAEEEDSVSFVLDTKSTQQSLSLILPVGATESLSSKCVQVRGDGYESLKHVVDELTSIMTERMFKFTLAQKTIGGPNPKTGNQWLYEGKLTGKILENLMDQLVIVIHNLQALTLPEEVDVVKFVRAEVERFEQDTLGLRADQISETSDAFVGNAIKKNFHPIKGRQLFLRAICRQFREKTLVLTPEEEIPAKHLGILLENGALMSDTFVNSPMEPTTLQMHPHFWRNILRRAVDSRKSMSKTALKRIWTCGLTDAGIHNLFVNETDLYFFDLGQPQLMSLPGFLTKFLFSFFHTLGMEDDGDGSWVRRFDVVGNKLALTRETQILLPQAYDAFEECLDRIIYELLDNDRHMRWLLLEYITMQLLSDTAFCLQKWQLKGGGKARDGNHQMNQEKWLWRALWDIYVAFDINTSDSWYRFDVEHPHFRESLRSSGMDTFGDSNSAETMRSIMTSMRMSGKLDENLLDFLDIKESSEEESPDEE